MSTLTDLLKDGSDLRAAYHGSEPLVLRNAVALDGLPRISDILALIDGSLLRRPYFSVLQDGLAPSDSELLAARTVAGSRVDGFIDSVAVGGQLANGATLKLNQVEDWHPFLRDVNDALNAVFPAESKAFLFYTPAGKRGMLPHRDGSRVIAIQLEGAKEWHLYDTPPEPAAGLDVDTSKEQVVVMEPGDLLYLPHGTGHAATAIDSTSLHVTFTLTEPFPSALVQAYIDEWIASGRPARAGRDAGSPLARAAALLADLNDFGSRVDSAALVDRALATARLRDGSR
ncbi:JmjC domain-containing protein [Kitasatospora paranensis]|uniref:JmjC domain-containing protein n=1 Tax=Kitasatospora paranensis TaxID=258053 RepID=A0ABW2FNR3_9ACTN